MEKSPKYKLNFRPLSAPVNSFHSWLSPPLPKTCRLFLSGLSLLECSHRGSIFFNFGFLLEKLTFHMLVVSATKI